MFIFIKLRNIDRPILFKYEMKFDKEGHLPKTLLIVKPTVIAKPAALKAAPLKKRAVGKSVGKVMTKTRILARK